MATTGQRLGHSPMLELQPFNESELDSFQILEAWLMTRRRLCRGAVGSPGKDGPWLRIYRRTTCQSSSGTYLRVANPLALALFSFVQISHASEELFFMAFSLLGMILEPLPPLGGGHLDAEP
eukprot:4403043-Pyramimonas_sp.AAC.1